MNPLAGFNFAPTGFGNPTPSMPAPAQQVPVQPPQPPQQAQAPTNPANNEEAFLQFLNNPLAAQAMAQQFANPQMLERVSKVLLLY